MIPQLAYCFRRSLVLLLLLGGVGGLSLLWAQQPAPPRRPTIPQRPSPGPSVPPTSPTQPGQPTAGVARGFVPEGIQNVAGVELNKTAEVLGNLADLRAAVYDPRSKRLILLGKGSATLPPFRPDDFAVVLRAVMNGSPIGVSIEDPVVEGMMTVRYIGGIEDTHVGAVLFEADRLLKCLAQGRDNLTGQVLTAKVPGHQSELDLLARLGGARIPGVWHRYWFRPCQVIATLSPDGKTLEFQKVQIEVATEYVPPVGEGVSEPAAEAFARFFTQNFDQYAQEFPVFRELESLAKMVAIARWLVEQGIPIEKTGLLDRPIPFVPTPRQTPLGRNELRLRGPQGIWIHQMQGGVDLGLRGRDLSPFHVRNWFVEVDPEVSRLRSLLTSTLHKKVYWKVQWQGETLTALALGNAKPANSSPRRPLARRKESREERS